MKGLNFNSLRPRFGVFVPHHNSPSSKTPGGPSVLKVFGAQHSYCELLHLMG